MMLASFMVFSALVVLATPVRANTELENDGIDLVFTPGYMTEERVYFATAAAGDAYNLGEGDGVNDDAGTAASLTLNVQTISVETVDVISDFYMNITDYTTSVFDFADTAPAATGVQISDYDAVVAPGGTSSFTYTFDILATNLPLGNPMSSATTLEISWDYIDANGGTPTNRGGSIEIYIYLSSIFDNWGTPALDETLNHFVNTNHAAIAGVGQPFEAGDVFAPTTQVLHNYDATNVADLTATVTPPATSGITLSSGVNYCTVPLGVATGADVTLNYRTDVEAGTEAGMYTGTSDVVYTRADSDLTITENNLNSDWLVDFAYRDMTPTPAGKMHSNYQCHVTAASLVNDTRAMYPDVSIVQPVTTDEIKKFNITITNDGNQEIMNSQFKLNVVSPTWDYFRNPNIYYSESSGPLTLTDPIQTITIESLPIGDSTWFLFSAIVAKEIPIGEHRLPIIYDGFYFNDGSLDEATGFFPINGGNGIPDGADDLQMNFSVVVSDPKVDCRIYETHWNNAYDDSLTYQVVDVDVENLEGYGFIDVVAIANFAGTPFYAPIVGNRVTQAQIVQAEEMPVLAWGEMGAADDELDLHFMVDSLDTLVPDLYPFTVTLTAYIETTLEPVNTTISGTVEIVGYGPEIWIEAFTTSDVKAGEYFDLNLTITNSGDDTLREAWVAIDSEGLNDWYDWDVICDFIGQIQRNSTDGGDFTYEGAQVTLEQLDIDSAKEIVALNLYIEGVYSSPSAVISLLWIDEIAPGESVNVQYQMICDKDMVNGKPYVIYVDVWGIDSYGDTWNAGDFATGEYYTITVMTVDKGTAYNPVEMDYFMGGMQMVGLVLFIIIVVAVLFYVIRKVVFPKKEEPRPPQ